MATQQIVGARTQNLNPKEQKSSKSTNKIDLNLRKPWSAVFLFRVYIDINKKNNSYSLIWGIFYAKYYGPGGWGQGGGLAAGQKI